MITIKPFKALRPEAQHAKAVASKPYDVLSSKEAKIEAQGNPNSFLHITKSEIDLPESTDIHGTAVYEKAKAALSSRAIHSGTFCVLCVIFAPSAFGCLQAIQRPYSLKYTS